MKEELLQIKQDIIDISNDLKTNLADKGIRADGTLSELVDRVPDIESSVLGEIGWNLAEQPFLKDAIEYAKEIQKNPKSNYQGDKQLVIFPKVDELELKSDMFYESSLILFPSNIKLNGTLYRAFYNCYGLIIADLTNSTLTGSTYQAFYNCYGLKSIGNPNLGQINSFYSTFQNCYSLESVPDIDISNAISTGSMFQECHSIKSITIKGDYSKLTANSKMFQGCDSLTYLSIPEDFPVIGSTSDYGIIDGVRAPRIYGSFDYTQCKGYGSNYYYWVCGFFYNRYTRYMLVKNLGYYQSGSYLNMERTQVWGIANDEVPDARQSLIDSLITYSFDRASAGYSTMTMKLYADVKALLTEDEIAQITAKGYTLV